MMKPQECSRCSRRLTVRVSLFPDRSPQIKTPFPFQYLLESIRVLLYSHGGNPFGSKSVETYNLEVREFFCYILECADRSYYTGWTKDPDRRLREHNAGHGARYTRTRRPLRLVYLEPQDSVRTAMRRERAIKSLSRAAKQALIQEYMTSEETDDGK